MNTTVYFGKKRYYIKKIHLYLEQKEIANSLSDLKLYSEKWNDVYSNMYKKIESNNNSSR